MDKTSTHLQLEANIATAELALKQAKLRVHQCRDALRAYRKSIRRGCSTRVSKGLTLRVFAALSYRRKKRVRELQEEVGCSEPAVRRALLELIEQGRAERIGRISQHSFYLAREPYGQWAK